MSFFEFAGIDQQGKRKRGRIQAESKEGALTALRASGIRVSQITLAHEELPFWKRDLFGGNQPGRKDVLAFYQDFATLLGANLPVDRALRLSARQATPRFRPIQQSLVEGVVAGRSLSEAMRGHSGIFADAAIEMVKAGEMSGTLAAIFERIATTTKRQQELRSAVTSALIYPALLLTLSVVIVIVVVSSLLPSIAPLFDAPGVVAPLPIRLMTWTQTFMAENWPLLMAVCVAILAAAVVWWQRPSARVWRNAAVRRVPVLGALLMEIDVSRTCRVLGVLVGARVPLPRALAVVERLPSDLTFQKLLGNARYRIQEGARLAAALEPLQRSAPQMLDMIRTGEEVNRLDDMLLRVADLAEDSARTKIDRLFTLLTPIITCIMGLVIGGLIMMIMTSILSINDLAATP